MSKSCSNIVWQPLHFTLRIIDVDLITKLEKTVNDFVQQQGADIDDSVDWSKLKLTVSGEMKLDLRQPNHRKKALERIVKELTDSKYDILISDQLDNNTSIYQVIQYEIMTQSGYLYRILSQIHSKLSRLSPYNGDYMILSGHFMQVSSMIFTEKLLLKNLFRSNTESWKLYLSIYIKLLLDGVSKLSDRNTFYLASYLRAFVGTSMYWNKQHFQFLIRNNLCRLVKKYATKLRYKGKVEYLLVGIHPGNTLRDHVNNLICVTRCHANNIYCHDKNDPVLRLYESEIKKAFLQKPYNHKLRYLTFTHALLSSYNAKTELLVKMTFSQYKERRLSYCAWILCKKSDQEQKFSKCKGCMLILYCCRNHQKKHWKYIHHQQCAKMPPNC